MTRAATHDGRVTALVLAAGSGERFGGGKLLAGLEGRPVLQHVLDTLAAAGIDDPLVVIGDDAAALETTIDWRRARRVRNPEPARGLASSLQLGWDAARAGSAPPPVVLVVLGDQPRLGADVVRRVLAEPRDPGRPVVIARHRDGSPNPVRIEPEAEDLVLAARGDRGLGPSLASRTERVRVIEVDAENPDVDTRADLERLAGEAWGARVRANADQVERFREAPDGADFYASLSHTFVADPARDDDPVLAALLDLARQDDRWLDVGAGAGRYALPLARRVREVVAVDPSPSMLDALRTGAATHGIGNIRTVAGRFPPDVDLRAALGPDPVADVALIAHVGYDIAAMGPFLDALDAAAGNLCVAVLMEQAPAATAAPFWPVVHGERRVPLPALREFVDLLASRGETPEVRPVLAERRTWDGRDDLLPFLRRQLWTTPGSPADDRLVAALPELTEETPEGRVAIRGLPAVTVGVVTWSPRRPPSGAGL